MMLTNPSLVFLYVWVFVIILYQAGVSSLLTPLRAETIYLVFGSCLFFLMGYLFFSMRAGLKCSITPSIGVDRYRSILNQRVVRKKTAFLFVFWLFGSFSEVLVFKNLPLISAVGFGAAVRYTEFGLPVLHGILNSMYFLLVFIFFLRSYLCGEKKSTIFLLLMFLWPVLVLSRMMMVAVVLQLSFAYLILARPPMYKILKLGVLIILSLAIFGWLGDLRSGREGIIRLAQLNFQYPDWAPTFPVWVYVYLVSPINNINYNILTVEPLWVPFHTLSQLFPSPVRDYLGADFGVSTDFDLVSSGLNVSSIYLPLIKDFGYLLAPLFFFFVGVGSSVVLHFAKRSPPFLIAWAILLYTVVQSVFSNHMLHLVFVFEFLFALVVFYSFTFFRLPTASAADGNC